MISAIYYDFTLELGASHRVLSLHRTCPPLCVVIKFHGVFLHELTAKTGLSGRWVLTIPATEPEHYARRGSISRQTQGA